MKGEGFLFLGILVFLFIVWVYSGGPHHPISFAGPYITPLTNVGQVSSGYGSSTYTGISVHGTAGGASASYQSGNTQPVSEGQLQSYEAQIAQLQKKVNQERLYGTPSPFQSSVTLSSGNLYATDPDQQYVSISYQNYSGAPITISGWKLSSLATDKSATIPYGDPLPTSASAQARTPIILQPGDQAIITTGTSPLGASFKENECTGYLGQNRTFSPYLNQSCPTPRDEFDRFYGGNKYKDTGCYDLVNSLGSCRTPPDHGNLSSYCYAFVDAHLTYPGCVASHQNDPGFSGHTWHVYLDYHDPFSKTPGKTALLWRTDHEAIKLMDSNGKTVAVYTSY